ncbi:unnamed protein product [Cyprideis torosa]|uniref:Uncharacterized protein n=1 Tax=Cyprideis torosa TaxID=163714 RepID=A0A7R8WR84_9CRUS|nr:unnamed protein product [Cyprideis torosa]CAG0903868.1 unnamed protein product [Cyprideis torosa]
MEEEVQTTASLGSEELSPMMAGEDDDCIRERLAAPVSIPPSKQSKRSLTESATSIVDSDAADISVCSFILAHFEDALVLATEKTLKRLFMYVKAGIEVEKFKKLESKILVCLLRSPGYKVTLQRN